MQTKATRLFASLALAAIPATALAGPAIAITSPEDGVAYWGPAEVDLCVATGYVEDPVPDRLDIAPADDEYCATVIFRDLGRHAIHLMQRSLPMLGQETCRTVTLPQGSYSMTAVLFDETCGGDALDADEVAFAVAGPE